jgi:hypothetical protein
VLNAIGSGTATLPTVDPKTLKNLSDLKKARPAGRVTTASVHAAFRAAAAPWIAAVVASDKLPADLLLDPTSAALNWDGYASVPGTVDLAIFYNTVGPGSTPEAAPVAAAQAWQLYQATGAAAVYDYVVDLVNLVAGQAYDLEQTMAVPDGVPKPTEAQIQANVVSAIKGNLP